jgi:hypothetical protein
MGVVLAGMYAANLHKVFSALPSDQAAALSQQAANQIVSSYEGAVDIAASYPQAQADQIVAAAAKAFTEGKSAAIGLGLALTVIALIVVWTLYPHKDAETAYFESVQNSPS